MAQSIIYSVWIGLRGIYIYLDATQVNRAICWSRTQEKATSARSLPRSAWLRCYGGGVKCIPRDLQIEGYSVLYLHPDTSCALALYIRFACAARNRITHNNHCDLRVQSRRRRAFKTYIRHRAVMLCVMCLTSRRYISELGFCAHRPPAISSIQYWFNAVEPYTRARLQVASAPPRKVRFAPSSNIYCAENSICSCLFTLFVHSVFSRCRVYHKQIQSGIAQRWLLGYTKMKNRDSPERSLPIYKYKCIYIISLAGCAICAHIGI